MLTGARLVVLGKQGAGKGTQCVRLSHHYVVPHISTGDIFRAALKARNPLGEEVRAYLAVGDLVPDDIVLRIVAERLEQDSAKERGFVLDGFPRTVPQAEAFDELLGADALDCVANIVLPTALVLRRLAGRRVCADCGANYSLAVPPRTDWICDVCGGEVVQRQDDTEVAIKRRLDLYDQQTAPLVAYFRRQGNLLRVPGEGSPDAVTERLIDAIDERLVSTRGEVC